MQETQQGMVDKFGEKKSEGREKMDELSTWQEKLGSTWGGVRGEGGVGEGEDWQIKK